MDYNYFFSFVFSVCVCMFLGSIIRCMRRLEELLRQMCQAAKAIGNTELENKFALGMMPFRPCSLNNTVSLKLGFKSSS